MCVCFDSRFARHEQANGLTGRGRRMKRRDRFAPQNRPERNPAERPGRDVLARRANRNARRDAAVRPHGRMRDGPEGRSPLRHAKPSWGGRQARAQVNGSVFVRSQPKHSSRPVAESATPRRGRKADMRRCRVASAASLQHRHSWKHQINAFIWTLYFIWYFSRR
jgi:hypothetical protein